MISDAELYARAVRVAVDRLCGLKPGAIALFEIPRGGEYRADAIKHLLWVAGVLWGDRAPHGFAMGATLGIERVSAAERRRGKK